MIPLERAEKLKQESHFLLKELKLYEAFKPFGGLTIGGSCLLGVQAYPDLDIYVPPVPVEEYLKIRNQLAAHPLVTSVKFKESDEAVFPGGLYLKPYVTYGNWQRLWKIDIWSAETTYFEPQIAQLENWKKTLTEELRAAIVAYKISILNEMHRTPMYSGYFIYRAFLDAGLRDPAEVTQYLIQNGIEIK
jgi:hypothetical protein